jgi:chemotaxis regulatin CheY-phosphate phosphatase CheZ
MKNPTSTNLASINPRQLFTEAIIPISEFTALGSYQGFINRFQAECTQGSGIDPNLLALNVQYVEDRGNWEVNEWLEQDISRWFEGNSETGQWNRHRNHNYGAGAFFVSENGQVFNAKVANPKADFKKSVGFGKETWVPTGKSRRYEAVQGGGNRIFYPSLDLATRELISIIHNVELPIDGDIWPWLLEHPEIPIGIAEGAKKALATSSRGFPCVSVLGIANWSVPRTETEKTEGAARLLMPELVALAAGGRLMPIWYDQDDVKSNLKAFISAKSEGGLLTAALKVAGADRQSSMMWWPSHLGKGIDDVIVGLLKQDADVVSWIFEAITISKNASIYAQVKRLYAIDENRPIESKTNGGYLSDHLDIKLEWGKAHAIIAGTGAGKTTLIKGKIKAWTNLGGFVVVITPTNNLGKQLSEDILLPHRHDFNNLDHLQLKASNDGGFVCCLDSLPQLEAHIPKDMPLLVVCEEADQLANHMTDGQTLKGKYGKTLEAFSRVLNRADALVMAEARIPENTLRFFEKSSNKPTRVFIHELETQKRQVTAYSGQVSGFEALILQRLRDGERLIITSDSQRELDAIERLIQQELPELKGMRNDQKTSYLPAVKELTVSPNEVLAREQLFCLSYSPSCKSGWDLTGEDKDGNSYEFDRVMAIFRVLPTSDQIQMLARYRPDCPWDIYLSETIQVSGNETNGSPRKLSRSMEEEAVNIAQGWGIDYDPADRPELEKIARDHYVVATARAGLEKRINRYSMVQRLIEDGHSVTEESLEYCKPMADRMKSIKKEIDREWAALVASVHLAPTDDLELAKKLEQLEAPSPEQRAKAEKIRLTVQHPGVDFGHQELTYQATRDYQALVRGVDMEAATRNIQAVAASQKKATTEHFEQSILAIHHLPRKADRAYLILDCGVLELLSSGKIFTSLSPEVLELKYKILARAGEWERQFSFHFSSEQAPISFLTRAAKCLAIKFHVSRPGKGDRLRQYQVYTPELIDRLIQEAMDKLEQVRSGYEGMTGEELDGIVENKRRSDNKQGVALTDDSAKLQDPLVALTAGCQGVIDRLLDLRSRVEARSVLLGSVMGRYLVASSTVSIADDLDIESADGNEQVVDFAA